MSEQIVSFAALGHDEIVRLARQQADSGEPCAHGFEVGTAQACAWERAYVGSADRAGTGGGLSR